jgi:zinc transport system ATP-binding protein
MDEPTVGVDARSRDRFYRLLAELHRDIGLTLILVTHDIGKISSLVNRVACLNNRLFFHGHSHEFAQAGNFVASVWLRYPGDGTSPLSKGGKVPE